MSGHGGDVVQELTTDHREVEDYFRQLEALAPGDPKRRQVVDDVIRELVRHSVAEEAYLYPAARTVLSDGDALADHELEEHAEAERAMKELESLDITDPRFDVMVTTLIRDVRHHITEEEGELFPRLSADCTQEELDKLGEQIRAAKTVAPTHPHPMAPDKPPFNKLLAPGAGLVDRVRDFLSGRDRD